MGTIAAIADLTLVRLGSIAERRWGLVTTAQAEGVGVSRKQLARMASAGAIERVAQGVYRMAGAPPQDHEAIYVTWLALGGATVPRTETGMAPVVAAGTTAAVLHGIGDFFPDGFDFIVPARKGTPLPGVRLRVRRLTWEEVIPVGGLPALTVERALADVIEIGTDLSLVAGAVREAVRAGKVVAPERLVSYLDPVAAQAAPAPTADHLPLPALSRRRPDRRQGLRDYGHPVPRRQTQQPRQGPSRLGRDPSHADHPLADIGKAVAQLAKPVIFTYGHEMNVSGQYPWSAGDTGSCGSSSCTPAQWIAAWDAVQDVINGNGAAPYADWLWAPNADTGGSSVNFTVWWPGADRVNMVGLDGYPQSGSGWGLCDFQELFGQSFTETKSLTSLPVFISETDLAPLSTSQNCDGQGYETITGFISDLFKDGGDGVLQFQDGSPALTGAQRTELDAALAKAPSPSPAPASPTASSTASPSASPSVPASAPAGGGGGNCAPAVPRAGGQTAGAEREPALLGAGLARLPETAGGEQ
jgi:hypothetical protein